MLKKTITYTDYNGEERTEDFYFNLTKAEITEMEVTTAGGLSEKLKSIVAAKDTPAMFSLFKSIILKAYGEKSDDGKHFRKSEAISEAFSQTEAYSELFMQLVTDENTMSAFINAIIPNVENAAVPAPAKN